HGRGGGAGFGGLYTISSSFFFILHQGSKKPYYLPSLSLSGSSLPLTVCESLCFSAFVPVSLSLSLFSLSRLSLFTHTCFSLSLFSLSRLSLSLRTHISLSLCLFLFSLSRLSLSVCV